MPKFTTTLIPPPDTNTPLILPTRTVPYPASNPPPFNDALAVRLQVFIDEQKCTPELEIDDDDARSWHWVIYDEEFRLTDAEPASKVPVAVVRLVPPPHPPHESVSNGHPESGGRGAKWDLVHEPHVKFGRVAVLAEYRGFGLGRRLMETAMGWAVENTEEINRALGRVVQKGGEWKEGGIPVWKGLALVHAQEQVERMYERLGFLTDEELGCWVEEGIDHVGMWKRLELKA